MPKFDEYCMQSRLGKYHEMYFNKPIVISNLLDTKFLNTRDLKLNELYEKTKKEMVVRVKATFSV